MTMNPDEIQWHAGTAGHLPALLEMIHDFYREERIHFDERLVRKGLAACWQDGLGAVFLLGDGRGKWCGYLVVSICCSIEYGGRYALLDELYLRSAMRGRGWGRRGIERAVEWARGQGVKVIRLEVHHHNPRAKVLYLRNQFNDESRATFRRSIDCE
jgi:GNAT superfamily N-acetyltransferase